MESLLKELNSELLPAEKLLLSRYYEEQESKYPMIFIMGPPRSGTTLFMQWLADTGLVSYPSNLLSRFYSAPIIGAKIQLLLTDRRYVFRNELGEFTQKTNYLSENGKTDGTLAPNEFWYFWRRFLAEPEQDTWTDKELNRSFDKETMLAEVAGISNVFEKPFAAKGMLFNYNIQYLDSIFSKALFIQIERDPVNNVASLLEARVRQLCSVEHWYSFKIPEYEQLAQLDPITQVAGQVHYINQAVTRGLEQLDPFRKMYVRHEEFCENPKRVYDELVARLEPADHLYSGSLNFQSTRHRKPRDYASIRGALEKFRQQAVPDLT
jgi:hypothetical protein